MTIFKIIKRIIASFLFSFSSFGFVVTHQVRPNSTFETVSLSNSCSTFSSSNFSNRCNVALFPYSKEQGISINGIGKSDGDSIDNGRDLIFDPITETLIRRLFEEKNFNSFTFSSSIVFRSNLFELSYSPYFLLADLYLFNPAFPEISLHLVNRESLRLSNGWILLGNKDDNESFQLSFGASLFYYKHTFENTVFSLFDLSFNSPNSLINFETEYGVASDLGLYLYNPVAWLPNISFQIKNLNSKVTENKNYRNSATRQSPLFLFEPYSTLGLGKEFQTYWGGLGFNLEIPIEGIYDQVNEDQITLGTKYTIKLFSVYFGLNSNYQNFGLRFNSDNFNVGINYARENDIGDLQSTTEDSVYTGLSIVL